MKRIQVFLLALLVAQLSTSAAHAQFLFEERLGPAPPADKIDAAALKTATDASLVCAARYLLDQAEKDYHGFAVEPVGEAFVVGHASHKTVERRYTEKLVDVNIYDYIYEDGYVVKEVAGETSMDPKTLQTVKVKQLVGKRKVGTRKEKRLIHDPDGSIVKQERVPTEPVYGDIWPNGYLGQNAMVLLALLKCGVPADHPVVKELAQALSEAIRDFGVPDTTWDVAWMAAALAHYPGERYKRARMLTISRLLDSQIVDGPARGLWGPVCINLKLLAGVATHEQRLGKEARERRAEAAKRPDSKVAQKKAVRADAELQDFASNRKLIAQQGMRFDMIRDPYKMVTPTASRGVMIAGLPFSIYQRALADIESTALVLYALREVKEAGHLPPAATRPASYTGKWSAPLDSTSSILARTARALSSALGRDGRWDERNIVQPHTLFKGLPMRTFSWVKDTDIPSDKTLLSTVQAFAALTDMGAVVGFPRLLGRYARPFTEGRKAQVSVSEGILDGAARTIPIGRSMAPFDFVFNLRGIADPVGNDRKPRTDLAGRLALLLVNLQERDGRWGSETKVPHDYSSSVTFWREYMDGEEDRRAGTGDKEAANRVKLRESAQWRQVQIGAHPNIIKTVYAMLFLRSCFEDGADERLAALFKRDADEVDTVRRRTVDKLVDAVNASGWEPGHPPPPPRGTKGVKDDETW